jgi:hypothetical protein
VDTGQHPSPEGRVRQQGWNFGEGHSWLPYERQETGADNLVAAGTPAGSPDRAHDSENLFNDELTSVFGGSQRVVSEWALVIGCVQHKNLVEPTLVAPFGYRLNDVTLRVEDHDGVSGFDVA